MSRTIWKYDLPPAPRQEHSIPQGAKVLAVQAQDGIGQVWMDIPDINAPHKVRVFRTFGTGHEIPPDLILHYIGTYQMVGGSLVWHVYEQIA